MAERLDKYEVIVKVGNTSPLKFNSQVIAHRAITVDALRKLAIKYPNCNTVVIEAISDYEYDAAVSFVKEYMSGDSDRALLFFADENDDITRGLADELDYDIYTSISDIYGLLSERAKFRVDTRFIKSTDRRSEVEAEEKAVVAEENVSAASAESVDTGVNTGDTGVPVETGNDTIGDVAIAEDIFADTLASGIDTSGIFDTQNIFSNDNDTDADSEIADTMLGGNGIANNGTGTDTSTGESAITGRSVENSYTEEEIDALNKTRIELSNLRSQYNHLLEDMKFQTKANEELSETVGTLQKAYNDTLSEFNKLFEASDVIEDPIPLSQYQVMIDDNKDKDAKNTELQTTIDSLMATNEEQRKDIEAKAQTIDELNKTVTKLSENLGELNSSVETGEIHKEVIAQFTKQLDEIKALKDEIEKKYTEAQATIDANQQSISLLTSNLNEEQAYRAKTIEVIQDTYKKIIEKNKQFREAQANIDDLTGQLQEADSNAEKLEASLEGAKKNIESLTSEVNNLTTTVNDLRSEVEDYQKKSHGLQEQLNDKEKQVTDLNDDIASHTARISELENELVSAKTSIEGLEKTNSEDADTIEKLNKTLEEVRAKLASTKSDLEKVSGEAEVLRNQADTLTNERDDLVGKLEVASSTIESNNGLIDELRNNIANTENELNALKESSNADANKISELEDTLKNVSDELKNTTDELDTTKTELDAKTAELEITASALEECNKSIESLKETIGGLRNTLKERESTIESLNNTVDSLNAQIENMKAQYSSEIEALKKGHETAIAKLNEEHESEVNSINDRLNETIETFTAQIDQINEDNKQVVDKLKSDSEKAIAKAEAEKQSAIETITSEKEQAISDLENAHNSEVAELNSSIDALNADIANKSSLIEQKDYEISIQRANIAQLELDAKNNEETISENDKEIERLKKKIETTEQSYKKILDSLKTRVGGISADLNSEVKVQELQDEIEKLNNEVKSLTAERDALLAKQGVASEQFNSAQSRIRELENNVKELESRSGEAMYAEDSADSAYVIELEDKVGDLENKNTTLTEKIGSLNITNGKISKENTELRDRVAKLSAKVDAQKETIESLSSDANTLGGKSTVQSAKVGDIRYGSRAQIITVFGSGSYGITTAAMTIARRLSATNNVLYVDFDLCTPTADRWLGKSPLVTANLRGANIATNDYRRTSLGLFYLYGGRFVADNVKSLALHKVQSKGGYMELFSGCYMRPSLNELVNANYTELFNAIGSQYSYIVIDAGRLGNSDLNDSLIRAMSGISTGNVVVLPDESLGIRDFNLKLNIGQFDINNISWIINMCSEAGLSEPSMNMLLDKMHIETRHVAALFDDQNIRGHRYDFTKNKENGKRLELLLMNSILESK